MPKKVIQVPVDAVLLEKLNRFSRKQKLTRSGRFACIQYLVRVEKDELDACYRSGYAKFPEEIEGGSIQVAFIEKILPKESW